VLQAIVDKFAQSVASAPVPAAAVDRIGSIEPAAAAQMPRLVVSVVVDDTRGTGLARGARSADVPVRVQTILQVAAGANGWSNDLRTLAIGRLPLKKNPSSLPGPFGADDISVTNVSTGTAQPYTLTGTPGSKTQFAIDARSATLRFGSAQTAGDKLDLTHWTMQWHDDVTKTRARGRLVVDVWASDALQLDGIARRLVDSVFSHPDLFRQNGFERIGVDRLEPIASAVHQPGSGTAFAAWKQRVGCSFVFGYETGGAESEGIPIKQIDVEAEGFEHESITVR
jgi:hypothetical protein